MNQSNPESKKTKIIETQFIIDETLQYLKENHGVLTKNLPPKKKIIATFSDVLISQNVLNFGKQKVGQNWEKHPKLPIKVKLTIEQIVEFKRIFALRLNDLSSYKIFDTKWIIYETIVMLCHHIAVGPGLNLEDVNFIGRKILHDNNILNFKSGLKGKKWLEFGLLPKKVRLNLYDATVFTEFLYSHLHHYVKYDL